MSFPLNRFYNIHRIYLSLIGMWPYQDKKTKFIRIFFMHVMMTCCCISHFTKLFSPELNFDDQLKTLPYTLSVCCILACYYGTLFNMDLVRIFWDRIQYDWNSLISIQEIHIFEQYASTTKLSTIILLAMFIVIKILTFFHTAIPTLLDVLLPLNESRPINNVIPLELVFDQEKYAFPALLCILALLSYVEIVMVSMYGSFMLYVEHTCGMFHLVGYTLDVAFFKIDRPTYTVEEDKRVYKNLIRSITIHKRAIEFVDIINTIYGRAYLVQMVIGCIILGLNIIQIFKIKSYEDKINDVTIFVMHIITSLLLGFLTNYMCQNVINQSTFVFDQAYLTPWYLVCPKTRRLLLPIMINSLKPYHVTIGYIFVSCNEFYAAFLQTGLSYAMIIYNLQ